jgi:hypothetical protein
MAQQSVQVNNVDKVMKKLKQMGAIGRDELASALKTEAEFMMTASKQIVPLDDGKLMDSGFVDDPKINRNSISVGLFYGTEYALIQHEDMNFKHAAGRKAKYLIDPVKEASSKLPQKVANRLLKRWQRNQAKGK